MRLKTCLYVCVCICVCVAGTCLTVFITEIAEEARLKLMSSTTLRMLIVRGLPAAVSILTKNGVKSYGLLQSAKPSRR